MHQPISMLYLANKLLQREYLYPRAWFRVVYGYLGFFIFYYSLRLLPVGDLLYSNEGYLPSYALNNLPIWGSLFNLYDSPLVIFLGLIVLALLGALMLLGKNYSWVPIFAWVIYIFFQNRNVLTINPSTDVVGYMLLVCFLILLTIREQSVQDKFIRIPAILYFGSWLVLGLCFSASGIDRIHGDTWIFGTGFEGFLNIIPPPENSLSLYLHRALLSLPIALSVFLNYLILGLFSLSLPFSLWRGARPYLLAALAGVFSLVLVISSLTQVVLGLFTFFIFLADIYYEGAKIFFLRHTRSKSFFCSVVARSRLLFPWA